MLWWIEIHCSLEQILIMVVLILHLAVQSSCFKNWNCTEVSHNRLPDDDRWGKRKRKKLLVGLCFIRFGFGRKLLALEMTVDNESIVYFLQPFVGRVEGKTYC